MSLDLIRFLSFQVLPASLREIKSLIFEYSDASLDSAQPLKLSKAMKDQVEAESGVRPIMPLPDLVSAPKMLIPIALEKQEMINQVLIQLARVAEIFHSPESCTNGAQSSPFCMKKDDFSHSTKSGKQFHHVLIVLYFASSKSPLIPPGCQ